MLFVEKQDMYLNTKAITSSETRKQTILLTKHTASETLQQSILSDISPSSQSSLEESIIFNVRNG